MSRSGSETPVFADVFARCETTEHFGSALVIVDSMDLSRLPNTSKAAKGRKIYSYLLRGLRVERPGLVWAADITYLTMRRGFSVSGRHHGLAHAKGSGLAHLEHAGS